MKRRCFLPPPQMKTFYKKWRRFAEGNGGLAGMDTSNVGKNESLISFSCMTHYRSLKSQIGDHGQGNIHFLCSADHEQDWHG